MGKRICNKTQRKTYIRCNDTTQRLYESIRGKVNVKYLDKALKEIDNLPQLNKKPIFVRNRKGVLVEIVGKNGQARKLGVDYCGGVFYFDGNKLGKRKLKMAQSFYSVNSGKEIETANHDKMIKVWKKIQEQSGL